jgi:hypothetical protein
MAALLYNDFFIIAIGQFDKETPPSRNRPREFSLSSSSRGPGFNHFFSAS